MLIYLIECKRDYETVYKIGYSKCKPNSRLRNLQTGNDGELKLIETFETLHGQILERTIHRFLGHEHRRGEWLTLSLKDVLGFRALCEKIEKNLTFLKENQ